MLERHCGKKVWFLVLRRSPLPAPPPPSGPAAPAPVQHLSCNSFVEEYLQLGISPWTAFPGTPRGVGFQQFLEGGFSASLPAWLQPLCHTVDHRRETHFMQVANWCMKSAWLCRPERGRHEEFPLYIRGVSWKGTSSVNRPTDHPFSSLPLLCIITGTTGRNLQAEGTDKLLGTFSPFSGLTSGSPLWLHLPFALTASSICPSCQRLVMTSCWGDLWGYQGALLGSLPHHHLWK